MTRPEVEAVWRVLPGRMPGMLPVVVALRFPSATVVEMTGVLEAMTAAGHAIRVVRRRVTVYYRGLPIPAAAPTTEQLDLFGGPTWT